MSLESMKMALAWKALWAKYEKAAKADAVRVSVCDGYGATTAVFDAVRSRCNANANTHRAVWLRQEENGHITADGLLVRLEGTKRLKLKGSLATADGKPGIADAKLACGTEEYEVIFTDLPFYTEPCDELWHTGGIVTCPISVTGHAVAEQNLLCAGGVSIEEGAELEVREGATLTFSQAVVHGTLKGTLTGVLRVEDKGVINGNLYAGRMELAGTPTLIGMYYGDEIAVADDSIVLLKEFGSLTTAFVAGKGVTLQFQDAEPLVLEMDPNTWNLNTGHAGGDAGFVGTNTTGTSWFLKNDITPTDLLGRIWSPELSGGGVLMPAMTSIGIMKNDDDLTLEAVAGTDHNYALLMLNRKPITHIKGNVVVHVVEGVACPPADMKALVVSEVIGDGAEASPYTLTYDLKSPDYVFESAEELAVQAGTKDALRKRFPSVDAFDWKFAPAPDGSHYTWYGYEQGVNEEHWDGPRGDETHIVAVRRAKATKELM